MKWYSTSVPVADHGDHCCRESIKFTSGGGAFVGAGRPFCVAADWRHFGGASRPFSIPRRACLWTRGLETTEALLSLGLWTPSACFDVDEKLKQMLVSSSSSSSGGPQLSRQPGLEGKDGWASPPLLPPPPTPPTPHTLPIRPVLPHFPSSCLSPLENLLIDECS